MLNKEEIEICKREARNYIEFMETAGDNAGWVRGLMWYIEKVENIIKQLNKEYERLTESVKRYEEMRRNCQDEFYFKSYQASIHRLNAKRETIKNIIEMLEEK